VEPKGVQIEDVRKLLSGCGSNVTGMRDRAVIFFFLDTGCRVGGLCKLRMRDLDLENQKALTIEKGDNPRTILFVDRTADAIGNWIEVRPFPENEFVFTSLAMNVPTNPNSMIQMLRRRKKRTGIQGRVNPHPFRHAFGRDFVLHWGDFASTSELMGHSQIHVTKICYAVFQTEELRPKHSKYSPVNWIPELEEERGTGDN
jgi:integrase/recombinase XerC